jgi:hypothetical protein
MRASTIDADYNFLKKVGKAKEEGRTEMTKLDRVMKAKAGKRGRKRGVRDESGKDVNEKALAQDVETREKEPEPSATMNDDGEGWTDDEESIEKEVERINRLPLRQLKDIISFRIPSFTFSSNDG